MIWKSWLVCVRIRPIMMEVISSERSSGTEEAISFIGSLVEKGDEKTVEVITKFVSRATTVRVEKELVVSRCELAFGEDSNRLIFLYDRQTGEWSIQEFYRRVPFSNFRFLKGLTSIGNNWLGVIFPSFIEDKIGNPAKDSLCVMFFNIDTFNIRYTPKIRT